MKKAFMAYLVSNTNINGAEIVKEIDIDDRKLFVVEVTGNGFVADDSHDKRLCSCYQNKQRVIFNPLEYAYIESTSNHYSLWHPIDPAKPVLAVYTTSLGYILEKLQEANITCFCRVHTSFIINKSCIKIIKNDKVLLENQSHPVAMGKEYKEEFLSEIVHF